MILGVEIDHKHICKFCLENYKLVIMLHLTTVTIKIIHGSS